MIDRVERLKKRLIAGVFLLTSVASVDAQCLSLSCPGSTLIYVPATSCGAVVNFNLPVFTNACATQTFNYTGSVQTYTVPPGVTSLTISAKGAQGENQSPGGTGGLGASVQGVIAVTAGQVVNIYVGGQNGYNGGGQGGINGSNPNNSLGDGYAAAGGGATDIRLGGTSLANRILVAGGGGGAGRAGNYPACQTPLGVGGNGGGAGLNGNNGSTGSSFACNCANGGGNGGFGATASTGGATGTYNNIGCLSIWGAGSAGAFGIGGSGSTVVSTGHGGGGGGGGGYYGGGSGANGSNTTAGGGGGGGSSFVGVATSTMATPSANTGNGQLIISSLYTATNTLSQLTGLASGSTFSIGTTLQTFSVTDGANSNTCSFSVTVIDATSPTIVCPSNVSQCVSQVSSIAPVSVLDNCPSPLVTYTLSGANTGTGVINATGAFNIGITNVLYRAMDLSGNFSTCAFSVTIGAIPNVSVLASSSVVCAGQSAQLTGSGANSYTWSSAATTGSVLVTPSSPTAYTVIGSNGICTNTAATTINVNPNPIITLNNGSICVGQTFTINPNGASTYTIQGGNSVVNPSTTSSYTVMGTSALGCISQVPATSSVTVNINPTITVNSGTICAGQNFTVVPSGATTYTFQGGTAVVAPLTNSSYTVSGTNTVTGCRSQSFATFAVAVNQNPTLTVAGANTLCAGQSASLIANGASTYTWSTLSTNTSVVVSPSATTIYSVAGSFSTGCFAMAVKTVTVFALPVVSISGSSVLCLGDSITLTVTGANTYVWYNTATSNSIVITPSASAFYSAAGTDTNGCVANSSTSVTVNPLPVMSVVKTSSAVCLGDSLSFTATGAISYSWTTGASTASIIVTPTASATYSVVGTNTFGCASFVVDSVKVNALPILTITVNNGTICIGESVELNLNGAASYSWSNGANTASISVSPSVATTYSASGTSTAACVSRITTSVAVSECTGLMTYASATSVKVYPNPSHGEFTLELSSINKSVVTITNMLGQVVFSKEADLIQQINISELNMGMYFINVIENNKSVYRANIVKH